jgi:hypothetical protein
MKQTMKVRNGYVKLFNGTSSDYVMLPNYLLSPLTHRVSSRSRSDGFL